MARDTIYAVSSGPVPAGVAVIRMSGPGVRFGLETMLGTVPEPRLAALRPIRDRNGQLLDRGLVLFFAGPASFTGEDVAELQVHGGRAVTASFDYGHFVCQFETAVDLIPHFDAHLEVSTPKEVIRVDYDTPYIRHQPARLTVLKPHGEAGASTEVSFPTRYDSFAVEWNDFHRNVTEHRRPKTSIADAREDLELFKAMAGFMIEAART